MTSEELVTVAGLVKKETKTKVIQRQVVEEKLLLDSIFVLQALKKSGMAFRNI